MYGAFRILTAWLNRRPLARLVPISHDALRRRRHRRLGHDLRRTQRRGCCHWPIPAGIRRREKLVTEFFTWYDAPNCRSTRRRAEPGKAARSIAGSVLCDVSLNHWHKVSGAAIPEQSDEAALSMSDCRRGREDRGVAVIQHQNADEGTDETNDTEAANPVTKPPQVICKMQCTACHNQ